MSDTGKTIALIKALAPAPEIDPEQVKQDVEDWLDDHPEATTTVQDGAITKAKLASALSGQIDGQSEDITNIKGEISDKVGVTFVPLERGNISMGTSGWTYSNSTTRVRIKQGTTVHLNAGDIIGLSTYSGYRMYVGWLPDGDSTYGLKGWLTYDFVAMVSGEYTVLLSKSPETTATVADFEPLFFIKPVGTINYKANSIDTLISNGANLLNLDQVGDGYLETNGGVYTGSYGEKYGKDYINVNAGEKYRFVCTASVTGTGFMRVICYDGANGVVSNISEAKTNYAFEYYEYGRGFCVFDFTIPSNVFKIRISWRAYGDGWCFLMKQPAFIANDVEKLRNEQGNLSTFVGNSHVKGIAHAGYTLIAPENTIPAFQEARKHGFKYVECDVRFTSDNIPVLLHDETINRTARNADGTELQDTVNINSITLEEAQEYDFGVYKSDDYAGTKIPSLEEFILLCKRLGLHPYIEIKNGATEAQTATCVEIVRKHAMLRHVTWIAYSDTILGYVKGEDAKARLGFVSSTLTAETISTIEALKNSTNEVFASISYSVLTDENVGLCIDADIPLEVWTLNTLANIETFYPYVSGITSDRFNADGVFYGIGMSQI